jgi:hypothetical protein
MLRFFTLFLLLLNGVYFAWSEGKLPGLAPESQTEPQRLKQQLKPNALRLVSVQELRPAPATLPNAKPTECLQAGPFSQAQSEVLRSALASTLAPASWALQTVIEPARWIVYMGKYTSPEALAKKRSELAPLNLRFEPLLNAELQLGLSLGSYETQAAANAALGALSQRGVRTARVLQERAETHSSMLRLANTDEAVRVRINELKQALGDKVLVPCK